MKKGWLEPGAPVPGEEEIATGFDPPRRAPQPLDAYRDRIAEWVQKEYSYVVMHRLIARDYDCSEATVRRYVKRHFPTTAAAVMVRATVAGETMEVDFGYLGLTLDEATGKKRKTYLF